MTIKLKLKRPKGKKSVIWTEFKKNGIHYKFYSGKSIFTKNWSTARMSVRSEEENHDLINKYLENWVIEIKRIFAEMEVNREMVTQGRISNFFAQDLTEILNKINKLTI